jgi:hypothetical protein
MDGRTLREQTTRAKTARRIANPWQSAIPVPDERPGLVHRWIRTSSLGTPDNINVSKRFRGGYVPVKAKDYPELQIMSDYGSRFPENIEVGGLLLCAAPKDVIDERIEHHQEITNQCIEAMDRNYMRESDPRMPVLRPERSTKVSFGK